MTLRHTAGIVLLLVALTLVGCQTAPTSPGVQRAAESTAESIPRALSASAVKPVTRVGYEAAFVQFEACMSNAGNPLVGVRLDGVVYRYSYLTSGEDAAEACYEAFMPIDSEWQLANEWESETQVALRACLERIGVTPGRDVQTVWRQIQNHAIDPAACALK